MATAASISNRVFTVLPADASARRELEKNWGWILALGILSVIVGFAAMSLPLTASVTFERVIAWVFIVSGLVETIHAFKARKRGGFVCNLFGALFTLAGGIFLLFYPVAGVFTLAFFLTVMLMVRGIDRVISAVQVRPTKGWGWILIGGMLSILLGVMIASGMPGTALWVMGVFIGIDILFAGWSMIFFSLFLRQSRKDLAAA